MDLFTRLFITTWTVALGTITTALFWALLRGAIDSFVVPKLNRKLNPWEEKATVLVAIWVTVFIFLGQILPQ